MIENKCKDCKCRHIGCHSICSAYKQYKEQMNEIHQEKENRMKIKQDIVNNYIRYYKKNKKRLHTCKFSNG